jgi:predicted nucleic acid-binding protein
MKIYVDVSCLNRPFDDQRQARIHLEAEAVTIILDRCEQGGWEHVTSRMTEIEIDANPDEHRRARVRQLLPESLLELSGDVFERAAELERIGFKAADAVHVAAAEALTADVLLSCDDRLLRVAHRQRSQLRVPVANPIDWLKEADHDLDT